VAPADTSPDAAPDVGSATAEVSPGDAVRDLLQGLFRDTQLGVPQALTGGASRSTWLCRVGDDEVVVQRQSPDAERDMGIEAAVLAAAADVPAPPLVAHVIDEDGVSNLVTRRVPGETIARRILRDDRFATARQRLADQLGRAAARTHRIDPAAVPGLELADPLDTTRTTLDELGEPHPTFEMAMCWLRDHRPADRPATIVHGDLRLGNVIVDDDGLGAVIDWELVHLGNPMADLGWLCAPAWRFGSPLPAAGVGTREALLAAYSDEAGVDVGLDELRWWEVAASLRWGVICMKQADRHRSGAVRSHELAAIGRRTCETEHDLFLALEGRW
jgi:aminoglycoside phosphotransferase (APT) family kinase protein